jgi:D-alanyl-D-alanine carboxypeptidase/D-alanyl-D-alanine-endopeptidase (penicillin-binding protein 4)
MKAILREKYLSKADVGVAVARVDEANPSATDPQIIYRFDSDIPLIPASNLKILTTSAFLDHFGSDFTFRTVLLHKGQDLYLIGDGDPTLGDAELLKKSGWRTTQLFESWAEGLKKNGIAQIRNVVIDDSVFDQVFVHPHWSPRNLNARYSAQIGGVNFNANCVDFYFKRTTAGALIDYVTDPPDTRYVSVNNTCLTGGDRETILGRKIGTNEVNLAGACRYDNTDPASVTIDDPPLFAATTLAETLQRGGVQVTGAAVRDRTVRDQHAKDPAGWQVVAVMETKLATVINRANKDSMNLYAECLCKRLGHEISGQAGSWDNGPAAVGEFLKKIGVPEGQFHLDDGCGLSRENNVSAEALVRVLAFNFHGGNRDFFLSSLAVPGEEGTFKKRFNNSLKTRVFGKSGYVNNVSALSGYLKARDDHWYAFSVLMNNLPGGTNDVAKQIQERIVAAVDDNFSPASPAGPAAAAASQGGSAKSQSHAAAPDRAQAAGATEAAEGSNPTTPPTTARTAGSGSR